MKHTGIIRRVDDLGRFIIPKNIREQIGISEGDPLEFCIEDGKLILVPYCRDKVIIEKAKTLFEDIRDAYELEDNSREINDLCNKLLNALQEKG